MGRKPLICLLALLLAVPAFAQTTFDPLALSVGARALGMGKAAVAVAEDGDTIFTNPAGLGEIDSFKFTSMSGRLLDEVNYTVLGGVYPLGEQMAVGIGFASAGVSGIELRNAQGTLLSNSDFSNSALFASFGKKFNERFSLGLNVKYYVQQGTNNSSGNLNATNLDIGILQKGLGWFAVGAVGQNLLSSSEKLPQTIKLGARMFILGSRFESAILSPIELTAVADTDLPLGSAQTNVSHFGVELTPNRYLTLRAGIDHNNYTVGTSFRYAGIGFHYAYHPYGNLSENTAHYFSLTFDERGWPPAGPRDVFIGGL